MKILSSQIKINLVTKKWMIERKRGDKIAHGIYVDEHGKTRIFFDGDMVKLNYPDEIDKKRGFGHGYAGEIEFDRTGGVFVGYTDQDGEDVGYYDLITQDIIYY